MNLRWFTTPKIATPWPSDLLGGPIPKKLTLFSAYQKLFDGEEISYNLSDTRI